jgi:hypothetical protein
VGHNSKDGTDAATEDLVNCSASGHETFKQLYFTASPVSPSGKIHFSDTSNFAEAMNATKRKFNALLSGIGNKSTTSLSSKEVNNASQTDLTTTTGADSHTKKRRISDSNSISSQNISQIKSRLLAKPSAAMPHKKSASLAAAAQDTEIPKYAPWDRTEFLKRLKSFSNITDWTPKPARVNEVEWAKRGWVCQKFERVRCSLCNVEILVKLNKKEVDGKEEPVYLAQNIGMFACLDSGHFTDAAQKMLLSTNMSN